VKVGELIDLLKDCDPDLMVVVDGYEAGLTELSHINHARLQLNAPENKAWYYGPHEHMDDEIPGGTCAVYLPRGR